ncbi:MAG: hypothetical protein ACK446_13765 [Rhodobacterales bacterium]|jgi:hypothetical protein
MSTTETQALEAPPQATDLERRVLAHERILQSLIAYMARAEPRFLDHLRRAFVEPMEMAHREQDFTDTDDYAEEFVHAVAALGEVQRVRDQASRDRQAPGTVTGSATGPLHQHPAERVRVQERNGIRTVSVDGNFRGDYLRREHAEAAAALARLGSG